MPTRATAQASVTRRAPPKTSGAVIHELVLRGQFAARIGGGRTLRFRPGVNVLCGANGSGKTTVFDAIFFAAAQPPSSSRKHVRSKATSGKVIRRDFERDNPRNKSWGHAVMMGDLQVAGLINATQAMSHGQTTRVMLKGLDAPQSRQALVLLDEPEQALDLDGLVELRRRLSNASASQIIVATHAPCLILEPSFHVVEMTPGYRDRVAIEVRRLAEQLGGAADAHQRLPTPLRRGRRRP